MPPIQSLENLRKEDYPATRKMVDELPSWSIAMAINGIALISMGIIEWVVVSGYNRKPDPLHLLVQLVGGGFFIIGCFWMRFASRRLKGQLEQWEALNPITDQTAASASGPVEGWTR